MLDRSDIPVLHWFTDTCYLIPLVLDYLVLHARGRAHATILYTLDVDYSSILRSIRLYIRVRHEMIMYFSVFIKT